ncbi:MAG: phospholipase D-like domain-containing protein [Flavobacteriales bacterium]|nr:phospholipase D-like domain-containing protein [Flavobacteriales bacterium]
MKKLKLLFFITILFGTVNAQDILTARSQGVGANVTVTGIATNGDELGPIRYIEDGTAGLALYDLTTNILLSNCVRGDSITVSGTLVDYNGLLELNPTSAAFIHSNGNPLPLPQLVTPNQVGESTESELIQIDNVIFNSGGSLFTVGTHDFTSNTQSGKIYIRTGHPLQNALIPSGPVTLIGISSQYTFFIPAVDGYQILPRDSADIIQSGNIILTSGITQTNITHNSFDLSWSTSDSATTECNSGLTSSLGTIVNNSGNVINHTISLTSLQPATFYYVQCYSVRGVDTAFSNIGIYSTASNSSGIIRPYFNHSVDNSVSTGVDAQNITNYFNDTIKAYIDIADSTLDICVYNASDALIATAINDAYNRGVQVRYIADDDVVNSMLSSLDPNIPIVYRTPIPVAGIMHNKFLVIDVNSVNNSWIMTGSTNWTNPSNLFNDYNNLIFVQDQALARAYTMEFEEMWSGIFGSNKDDNTPHDFNVNGKHMELYFSPSDQTTSHILEVINSVDYTLEFALLDFTRDDLGDAIIDVHNSFGTNVRGIVESENTTGSEFPALNSAGVNIKSHTGIPHTIHHKYAIADADLVASDPILLTGSHNWSNNAENNSDENTLIIHDHTTANIYLQEFTKRFNELSSTSVINNLIDINIGVFPNPSLGEINIETDLCIEKINVYQQDGKLLKTLHDNKFHLDKNAIYFLKIFTKSGNSVKKVIVQ